MAVAYQGALQAYCPAREPAASLPGVAPLFNDESTMGISALFANAEFERCDVMAQAARPVTYTINIAQVIKLYVIDFSVQCYLKVVEHV
jgi:hypothetical protein